MCCLSLLVRSRICYFIFSTLICVYIIGAIYWAAPILAPEIGEATNSTNSFKFANFNTNFAIGGEEPSVENKRMLLLEVFGLVVLLLTNATALHGLR